MRTPGIKMILLLIAALMALAIAGCGGGGGDETTETAATVEEPQKLTKDELIGQGDDICAEVNAAVGALDSEPEESAVPATIEKTANLYTGLVERLEELGTPEGDDGSYAKFNEAAEQLAKVEGEVKLAAEREDTEALGEAATEATPALEEFETQAEIYGFEECSQGPGAVTPSGTGRAGEEAEGGAEIGGVEEGGVEAETEIEEAAPEVEEAPEAEAAPETGGAGGGAEAAPEGGGGGEPGGSSGGVGPG
jgi:hypothetical protein